MHYAFIDTNIFIRIMSQGTPGCEIELFYDLITIASNNVLKIIIPEIILFKLENQTLKSPSDIRSNFDKIEQAIYDAKTWNEIENDKQSILKQVEAQQEEKHVSWLERYTIIKDFIHSDNVSIIPTTPQILDRAKERINNERMPRNKKTDQDAAIIESLVEYFSYIGDPCPILLFCSENTKDFAQKKACSLSDNSPYELHPYLRDGLPLTRYSINLRELLDFNIGFDELPLVEDEAIQMAQHKVNTLASLIDDFDSDHRWDEYIQSIDHLDNLINKQLARKFETRVHANLTSRLQRPKGNPINQYQSATKILSPVSVLGQKSEEKLTQWIEYIPENMLPYASLSKLYIASENLKNYLQIHLQMPRDEHG